MIEIQKVAASDCWQIRHEVMWPNMELDYVKLPNDDDGTHFGLFKDNRLIAVISLFIRGKEAQFRKFACLNSEQGNGYGSQLLKHVLDEVSTGLVERIFCNARVEKAAYYQKFGMKQTLDVFEKGGKKYVIMER
jgi:predicted GNAT family N-acyltransferase